MSTSGPDTKPRKLRPLAFRIAAVAAARLCVNTARRFPYPFAPAIARGLGLPVTNVTSIVAMGQGTTLLSPLFAPLGDRWGYRAPLLAGVGLVAGAMLLGGAAAGRWALLAALLGASLGKAVFDPSLHAYIGDRVPFERRGLAIGAVELGWAGSALIGLPLVGLAIHSLGWRSPFLLISAVSLGAAVALHFTIGGGRAGRAGTAPVGYREAMRGILESRPALVALGAGFLMCVANDGLFIVYGVWLEDSHGLGLAALGASTTVIGLGELAGEGLTALLADRLGLRRSFLGGLALSALAYAALPFLRGSLAATMGGLFVAFLAFEFAVVVSFSLCTELLPAGRATMMSTYMASLGLGRVLGGLMGGALWPLGGIGAVAAAAAALSAAAATLVWLGLKGWQRAPGGEGTLSFPP